MESTSNESSDSPKDGRSLRSQPASPVLQKKKLPSETSVVSPPQRSDYSSDHGGRSKHHTIEHNIMDKRHVNTLHGISIKREPRDEIKVRIYFVNYYIDVVNS